MQQQQYFPQEMGTRRPATYEDLLTIPEHLVAEIIDGELITSPRPALRHADVCSGLLAELRQAFDHGRGGPGGWRILYEPELHLRADVLVPDIAGWHRQRLPVILEEPWLLLAPDWVCEVLSPFTAAIDRARKLPVYAREGVTHAWLVDPGTRTTEVLRRDGSAWTIVATCAGADQLTAEPFDAIEIDLRQLWGT